MLKLVLQDLMIRLTSRKFWLTVATLITLAVNHQWNAFAAALIGYVVAQGAMDGMNQFRKK